MSRFVTQSRFSRFTIAGTLLLLALSGPTFAQKRRPRAHRIAPAVVAIDKAGLEKVLNPGNAKPLLVNYWATWCDPCRDEFPDLVKIDSEYRVKGLDFVAVTLDDLKDIKTAVPRFLRQMHAKMPVYLLNLSDPEPAINMVDPKWGGALPATFLYNGNGEVVYKSFGRINVKELRAALDKLVGNSSGQ